MKTKGLTILAILALISMSSFAQENEKRFGLEISSGASFSTSKPWGEKVNPGFGAEGLIHYRFMPHFGAFAGWGWNKFRADESFAGNDVCFEETGYVLGFQYKHPVGESKTSYYLRAGGLYNHIELETDGEVTHDSGHGPGWQIAGGFDIQLGKNWSLTPGIKFNSLSRETEYEGTSQKSAFNYLSVRVGILKKF